MKLAKRMKKRRMRNIRITVAITVCVIIIVSALIVAFWPSGQEFKWPQITLFKSQQGSTIKMSKTNQTTEEKKNGHGNVKTSTQVNENNAINTQNTNQNYVQANNVVDNNSQVNNGNNQVANNQTTSGNTVTNTNNQNTNGNVNNNANSNTNNAQTSQATATNTNTNNQNSNSNTNNNSSSSSKSNIISNLNIKDASEDKAREIAVEEFKKLGETVSKESLTVLDLQRKDGLMYYYIKSTKNTCEIRKKDGVVTRINANPVNQ